MHRIDVLIEAAGWWSYLLVFAATAAETAVFVGVLVPGEAIVLGAAAIAGRGDLDPVVLATVVVAGAATGDNLGYVLGRRLRAGRKEQLVARLRLGPRIERADAFLLERGAAAVVTGRFVGFVRTFMPFLAGASGMPHRRFLLSSAFASLLWGTGNVLLGCLVGAMLPSAGLAVGAAAGVVAVLVFGAAHLRRGRHPRTKFTGRPG
ncbi:DedA family protein [Streptomyces anthocyanicus]|uniref:DedA family protein n=1 Tax=Streptomyces anthocyanicus TaxID=68174 RepID=UPI002F90C7C8|nr:DedA family protein [Streptomyces anthocyanicus]